MVKQMQCKNCGGLFPISIIENGKKKTFNKRKYCFKCSPRYSHNTKTIEKPKIERDFKKSEKYRQKRENNNTKYQLKKDRAVQKLGGKCHLCGRVLDAFLYDFHHIEPAFKEDGISHVLILKDSWEEIEKELNKCILLCGNCHNELHSKDKIDNKQNRHAEKYKLKSIEYLGGKCNECGYNNNKNAMVFHHKDPSEKNDEISGLFNYKWERIRNELDKCVLLCVNCHRTLHHNQNKN